MHRISGSSVRRIGILDHMRDQSTYSTYHGLIAGNFLKGIQHRFIISNKQYCHTSRQSQVLSVQGAGIDKKKDQCFVRANIVAVSARSRSRSTDNFVSFYGTHERNDIEHGLIYKLRWTFSRRLLLVLLHPHQWDPFLQLRRSSSLYHYQRLVEALLNYQQTCRLLEFSIFMVMRGRYKYILGL